MVFDGQFQPREGRLLRQSGTGILRFHFDNIPQPGPEKASGTIAIAFRAIGGVRQVRTHFLDFTEGVEPPLTAAYDYIQLRGGQGRLRYPARQDFKNDGEPYELVGFNGAWTTEQAGRVAVRVEGGSLEINEFVFDECWDSMGVTTYADARPNLPNYDGGAATDWEVSLRGVLLAAPEFQTPVGDPVIPSAHPDEAAE